jgi:hypothetical protein
MGGRLLPEYRRGGAKMSEGFIPLHGGYQNLLSYRKAEIVYDATVFFCDRYIDRYSRTRDQMVQAARSGKQNIIEGSLASGTSKESEIKLTNIARPAAKFSLLLPLVISPPLR